MKNVFKNLRVVFFLSIILLIKVSVICAAELEPSGLARCFKDLETNVRSHSALILLKSKTQYRVDLRFQSSAGDQPIESQYAAVGIWLTEFANKNQGMQILSFWQSQGNVMARVLATKEQLQSLINEQNSYKIVELKKVRSLWERVWRSVRF